MLSVGWRLARHNSCLLFIYTHACLSIFLFVFLEKDWTVLSAPGWLSDPELYRVSRQSERLGDALLLSENMMTPPGTAPSRSPPPAADSVRLTDQSADSLADHSPGLYGFLSARAGHGGLGDDVSELPPLARCLRLRPQPRSTICPGSVTPPGPGRSYRSRRHGAGRPRGAV